MNGSNINAMGMYTRSRWYINAGTHLTLKIVQPYTEPHYYLNKNPL